MGGVAAVLVKQQGLKTLALFPWKPQPSSLHFSLSASLSLQDPRVAQTVRLEAREYHTLVCVCVCVIRQ